MIYVLVVIVNLEVRMISNVYIIFSQTSIFWIASFSLINCVNIQSINFANSVSITKKVKFTISSASIVNNAYFLFSNYTKSTKIA